MRALRNVGVEPFFIDRAAGSKLWDVDGNEYVDYVGSWGPAILGHAPKTIVDAVREAATRGVSFGIPNPLEVKMADLICKWVPSIEKLRMVNSGTEATMSCIRLARGFTGRDKIIKFDGCYHGHVDGLLVKSGSGALTHGQPDSAGVPRAFADLTISLPFNDVDLVLKTFRENENEIAAVILEPIPANAGLYFPNEDFLSVLREKCTRHGALLIFDELMTGFRVARGGAQEIYKIKPDLTALGKVIGGGLPVGAFGGQAALSIRPARSRAIRWRWRRVWRSCANWSRRMVGSCSKNVARNWNRLCAARCKSPKLKRPFIGSDRCSVCFLPAGRLSILPARSGAM